LAEKIDFAVTSMSQLQYIFECSALSQHLSWWWRKTFLWKTIVDHTTHSIAWHGMLAR